MAKDAGGSLRKSRRKKRKDTIGPITDRKSEMILKAREASRKFKKKSSDVLEKSGRLVIEDPVAAAALAGSILGGRAGFQSVKARPKLSGGRFEKHDMVSGAAKGTILGGAGAAGTAKGVKEVRKARRKKKKEED